MQKEIGGGSLFSVPKLLVGLTKGGAQDADPARSPTSPLDCKVFFSLGGYLARSPRSPGVDRPLKSWNCDRVGLGLVDALADDANVRVRVVSSAASPRSLPKSYVTARAGRPELVGARSEPAKPGKIQSCSTDADRSSRARKNLNSEAPHSQSKDVRLASQFPSVREVHGGSSSGSLPIAATHSFAGSLAASDIEQSEDYTCIISRGPNPKTTRIFGDYILESYTNDLSDFVTSKPVEEGKGSPWMLCCSEEPIPFSSTEDFLRVCHLCKKKLEGKDIYMYGGQKAFCSSSCRAREILVEEDTEETATGSSSASPSSTSCEEIFLLSLDAT